MPRQDLPDCAVRPLPRVSPWSTNKNGETGAFRVFLWLEDEFMSAFECFAKGALRRSFIISAWALTILFLNGCSAHEKAADLRIINGKEPESLDPATVVGQPDERVCLSCFEGLTRYNAVTAAPEPA